MPNAAPAAASTGRVFYYDVLRALAVIAVVVLHVAALEWKDVDPASSTWQVYNAYDSLVRWCVPVFVMLSGALMLDPARPVTLERLLHKNVARLALAFAVWSAVYLVWDVACGAVEATPKGLLHAFVTGHYHLWYLQMQVFLYLIVPLLRPMARERRLMELMVCLSVLFCFMPNLVFMSQAVADVLSPAYDNMGTSFVCGYVGYFVLGRYLATVDIPRRARLALYGVALVALAFTAAGTSWLSVDAGFARGELYGYLMPNTLVVSAAVFVAARHGLGGECGGRLAQGLPGRVLARLSSASLGIYLVHLLVLEGLQTLGAAPDFLGAVFGVPLLSLAVLLVSFALVWLLGKVAPLRRVL